MNRRMRQRFLDSGIDLRPEPTEIRMADLSRNELKALIRRSYALVARKLTRKRRTELGLD